MVKTPRKRGGKRNVQSFDDKAICLDEDLIRTFINTTSCGCERECIRKLKGDVSRSILTIHALRAARFTGQRVRNEREERLDQLCALLLASCHLMCVTPWV